MKSKIQRRQTERLQIRVTPATKERLLAICTATGKSQAELIRQWADSRKVKQVALKPDFKKYPAKQAPYKRNDTMLEILPVGVLVFGNGGIQANLFDKARKLGIPARMYEGGA